MKLPEFPPNLKEVLLSNSTQIIDLVLNTSLTQQLGEIDREYLYWEKFKYKTKQLGYSPEVLWVLNKFSRGKSIARINLSNIPGFDFKFNTTGKTSKYLHQFDLHLGGLLGGRAIIPSENKNRYLISSIMEEAIASSQLEGAATTRADAKEMLRNNRKPVNLSERMILNNYLTIQKVMEIKDKSITKDLILDLHATISKDTLKDASYEGKFRSSNDINVVDNVTGEVYYRPPDHEQLDHLMDCFCDFANSKEDKDFIHPIIRAIILHFLIGYIHPFTDGNGRTARALFYWYLISKGYWLVEYMSISKVIIRAPARYGRAFLYSEYDENDLTYFIDYNLQSMDLALQSLQKYIQRKLGEKKSLFALIKNENINERQAEILRSLISDPGRSLSIKGIQTKFGVVYQTARTDLIGLQNMGYVQEKKMGKKLIYFRTDDFDSKLEKIAENQI